MKEKDIHIKKEKLFGDENDYPDKNTVVLINILSEIIVRVTLEEFYAKKTNEFGTPFSPEE